MCVVVIDNNNRGYNNDNSNEKIKTKREEKIVEEIVTAHHAKINYGANGKLDHDKDEGKRSQTTADEL